MSEQRSFIVPPQKQGINVYFVDKAAELRSEALKTFLKYSSATNKTLHASIRTNLLVSRSLSLLQAAAADDRKSDVMMQKGRGIIEAQLLIGWAGAGAPSDQCYIYSGFR